MADYLIRIVATDATEAAVAAAKQKLGGLGESAKTAATQMKKVGSESALTKNELLTLNYTMSDVVASLSSGASPMTILMQQGGQVKDAFGGIGPLFSKIGTALRTTAVGLEAPIAVVAAATLGMAYAFEKGEQDSRNFAKTLQLTGNYAAMSSASYEGMISSVSELARVSQSASRSNVLETIGTGRFSPDEIKSVTVAATEFSRASGKAFSDVIAGFASMRDKVSDGVSELNKQYHFLTAAQYEQIKSLEDAGNSAGAMKLAMDSITASVKEQKANLGYLESGWRSFKDELGDAWERLKSIGRDSTDADKVALAYDRLNAARERYNKANEGSDVGEKMSSSYLLDQAQKNLDELLSKYNRNRAAAKEAADEAARQQKGIDASNYFDSLDKQYNKSKALTKALQELENQKKNAAAAGTPISDTDYEAYRKNLIKSFRTPDQKTEESAAAKLESAFGKERDKLGEESASIASQIQQWDKYGDTVNHARQAEVEFLTTSGKLKDLSAEKKQTLADLASSADEAAANLKARQDYTALANKVKVIQAEADATDTSARATQEAALMAQLETIHNRISTEQYTELTAAIKKANDARADKALEKTLKEQNRTIDEQIRKLREQNELIGQSELSRRLSDNTRTLQDKRDKTIDGDKSRAGEIYFDYSAQIKRSNAAIEENYNASLTWDAGWKTAFADYKENATNAANDAQQVFSTVTGGMETMIVDFVTTGKASFGDFARSVLATMAKIAAQKLIMSTMSYFGFGTGHDGAVVGESYTGSKTVSASAFTGAPRFHTGGITGDEVPVIAKKGEGIFTQAQMKKLAPVGTSGATVNVTLNVVEDSSRAGETEQQQSDSGSQLTVFVKQIKDSIAGDIAEGSGSVTKAIENTYNLSRQAV